MQATKIFRCTNESPLARAINRLNPNGFGLLGNTAPKGKWVHVAYDANEAPEIEAAIDANTPAITAEAWRNPVQRELWIPGEWLEEVGGES